MRDVSSLLVKEHSIPDAEVVERVLAGEKELYELLMRRHNQKLYRVIRSYLKDEAEIEDAMQNAYLKAYEKLYQFKAEAQFSTWLVRIGINEALGRLREKGKYTSILSPELGHLALDVLQLPDAISMNPENKAIQKEVKLLLEKAIDNLPAKYKTIYMLREIEEMSNTEVAACLNLSESNVKVRHHRAKALLKESLYALSVNKDVFAFGYRRCDALVAKVMAVLPER
ncbi:RNA polymerase sigma factor [Pontibacter vulgaris]|uniref:RNA polymerase sigma factor n=1 Tax=Pontibacter vulgaris TaxID=2905679 RepID=UPI001FA6D11C|nr:RNA polymerase sigma factor [Pontibacter vulgaris]